MCFADLLSFTRIVIHTTVTGESGIFGGKELDVSYSLSEDLGHSVVCERPTAPALAGFLSTVKDRP